MKKREEKKNQKKHVNSLVSSLFSPFSTFRCDVSTPNIFWSKNLQEIFGLVVSIESNKNVPIFLSNIFFALHKIFSIFDTEAHLT